MRRNGYSAAYRSFEGSLQRATHLYRLERRLYSDPPAASDQAAVEALRGGASVLLVASLESYLRDALAEYIDLIAVYAMKTTHIKLPIHLAHTNDLNFINWLIRDGRMEKQAKIIEIQRVSALIANSRFVPESFNRTRANPGPDTVKTLLKEIGINNPLATIEARLPSHYPQPFAGGFVETNLRTIVGRRNDVAHGSSSLSISRLDLKNWIEFMQALGKSIDNVVRDHCFVIIAGLK